MEKKTTIIYNEEEDMTYITSNVPKDMLKLLDKYEEEYIDFEEKEEIDDDSGSYIVKNLVLSIPGKIYNFVKAK